MCEILVGYPRGLAVVGLPDSGPESLEQDVYVYLPWYKLIRGFLIHVLGSFGK